MGVTIRLVIFLLAIRDYDVSVEYSYSQEANNFGYKEQKKIVKDADNIVKKFIFEDFILYVPNFCVPLFVALYSNKSCKEARYIQEGAYTQRNIFRLDYGFRDLIKDMIRDILSKKPLRLWMPCSNYTKHHLYKQRVLHSYAVTNRHFRNLPATQHVIKWPQIKLDVELDSRYPIFITDGFIKNKMAEEDVYYNLLEKLIKEYRKDSNYIKFHPAQSEYERNTILRMFSEEGVGCEVLSDGIPMEIVIMNQKNLTFVGMGSSLLYYAHDSGHVVICHDDWMLENSEMYRRYYANTGAFLFKDYYK